MCEFEKLAATRAVVYVNRESALTMDMAFVIDQEHLPAILTSHPMTDEQFARLCAEHPELFFEMTADGELIVMPATYSIPGLRNSEIIRQLGNWAMLDKRGVVSDSSTGFVLPNGARRSPEHRSLV